MDNRKMVFGVLIIVTLLTINLMTLDKLKSAEKQLHSVSKGMNSLKNRIDDLSRQIQRINDKAGLVNQHSYDIKNPDSKYINAAVEINVTFNELGNNTKAYIMYKDFNSKDNNWNRVELTKDIGLNYSASLELSYDDDYSVQVLVEDDTGSKSEELSSIQLKSELSDRINISAGTSTSDSDGNLTYNVTIDNIYGKDEKLRLRYINCFVYYKDQLVETVDIMKNGKVSSIIGLDKIEQWTYEGKTKLQKVENADFMDQIRIEVVVKDGLGREYDNKNNE